MASFMLLRDFWNANKSFFAGAASLGGAFFLKGESLSRETFSDPPERNEGRPLCPFCHANYLTIGIIAASRHE